MSKRLSAGGNGMKAVLQTKYGSPDILKFVEVDKPFPKHDQVLIRVQAIGLNMADWRLLTGVSTRANQADLFIKELIEAGKVTPVVDRCYPFSDIRQALGCLAEEHALGKVVVSMAEKQS
jgi:NADPH:quinone reductase-like Zn-dependent oxidoreductase